MGLCLGGPANEGYGANAGKQFERKVIIETVYYAHPQVHLTRFDGLQNSVSAFTAAEFFQNVLCKRLFMIRSPRIENLHVKRGPMKSLPSFR
jgi:hypothetical protein